MTNPPPEWPFRCPYEGWYLSHVKADFGDSDFFPSAVYGTCKEHGLVRVTDPRCYSPDLWRTGDDEHYDPDDSSF